MQYLHISICIGLHTYKFTNYKQLMIDKYVNYVANICKIQCKKDMIMYIHKAKSNTQILSTRNIYMELVKMITKIQHISMHALRY